jgi:hypothetical protein
LEILTDLPPAFQNWNPVAIQSSGGESVAFGIEAAPADTGSIWQIDLPGEEQEAATRLEQVSTQIEASRKALDDASYRLASFIQHYQSGDMTQLSFTTGAVGALPEPELELMDWLEFARPTALEFGVAVEAPHPAEVQRLSSQAEAAMEKLLQQVLHFAWVETRLEGRLLARSLVSWGGDVDTVWGAERLPGDPALHRRSLALAIISRGALLRLIMIVSTGALKISLLLATPGGAILALPAAWNFVHRILSELESYQSQSQTFKES